MADRARSASLTLGTPADKDEHRAGGPIASAARRAPHVSYGVVVPLAAAAVGFVFWRAWVCDDAFITFRHVANCLAGCGPVFNVGERVQGFTHPLWFLLLLAGGSVLDVYAFAVTAGLVLTAALVLALAWLVRGRTHAPLVLIAAVAVLLSSRSFVEFQTSGLETSLTNLLVVLLFATVLRRVGDSTTPTPVGTTALLCSLLLLTRPDHLVICGPIFAWSFVQAARGEKRKEGPPPRGGSADAGHEGSRPLFSQRTKFIAALVPLIAWYGFAAVYYGTPLPNTAYAKVALPLPVAVEGGCRYVSDYASHEPLHAALIACVLIVGAVWSLRSVVLRRPAGVASVCLMAGLWLELAYVVGVGGDFMRGRFLVPLLVGAVTMGVSFIQDMLALRSPRRVSGPLCGAALVVALLLAGASSLWDRSPRVASLEAITAAGGIADEYAWYSGRWDESRFQPPAEYPNPYTRLWVKVGGLARRYADAHGRITIMWQAMGILPYLAGPKVHVVDQYGLTDAFVARCPANPSSRIGHIQHEIPIAYLEARAVLGVLRNWGSRMEALDPALVVDAQAMARDVRWDDPADRERWQSVRRMISGDVFSWERIANIPAYTLGGW